MVCHGEMELLKGKFLIECCSVSCSLGILKAFQCFVFLNKGIVSFLNGTCALVCFSFQEGLWKAAFPVGTEVYCVVNVSY